MTKGEKNKFLLQNPKKQLITKTDLAKVRNTWQGLPNIVSRGAQTNFVEFARTISDEWEASEDALVFNEKYFQESVALIIIFRHTELMVTRQPWYSQGYRANIVTYTIALLHRLIQQQFPGSDLDLMSIWNRQSIPSAVETALTDISELVYHKLTASDRGVENVTQWCKREACWNSVKSIDYILSPAIKPCLISQSERRVAERDAKSDQRIISGAEVQAKIIDITPKQWESILAFATSKRMVSPDEHTAIRIACQIPMKMPTPPQCKKLIVVLERLQEEGYKL